MYEKDNREAPLLHAHYRDHLKSLATFYTAGLVAKLVERNVSANQVSLLGCAISLSAIPCILYGFLPLAGLVYLAGSSLDFVDGAVARATEPTRFGQFLDSMLDRLADGAVLSTIIISFAAGGRLWLAGVAAIALVGSFLTSYARARAEGLGIECGEGLITRFERALLIGVGLAFDALAVAVGCMAALGIVTVLQRLRGVYRKA